MNLNVVGLSPSTTPGHGFGERHNGREAGRDRHLFGDGDWFGCGLDPDRASCVRNEHGFVVRSDQLQGATSDSVVCTITNTRSTGSVKVIKHWVGGATGETPGVDLNVSGPSSSTTQVAGLADGSTGEKPVVTGTYSAT